MSKITIPKPKVFISYAWKTKDYETKVLSFVERLRGDCIDTVFDKFELHPGNDTFAFMERSVNDTSVTNVLMLLDPVYAEKANRRTGGVGTETQIISAEVYNKVTQTKFIPVVFERDENGNVCKPVYLRSSFHVDLSLPDEFESNYQFLVKKLFGVDVYQKPSLGNIPSWVESTSNVSKLNNAHENLKIEQFLPIRNRKFLSYLEEILVKWDEYVKGFNNTSADVISFYDGLLPLRDKYLNLLSYDVYLDKPEVKFADFLQDTYRCLYEGNNSLLRAVNLTMLHEIFLYTIAHFYKVKNYDAVGYILTKSYFNKDHVYDRAKIPCNYHLFYSGSEHTSIDRAMCKKDGKNYHSGTAEYWISNLNVEICSKNEFVMADLLCYNCSVLGNIIPFEWYWFPLTYVYDGSWHGALKDFAVGLNSQERLSDVLKIFGYNATDQFVNKFREVEIALSERKMEQYRYLSAFESAPLLCNYIKHDGIGKYR